MNKYVLNKTLYRSEKGSISNDLYHNKNNDICTYYLVITHNYALYDKSKINHVCIRNQAWTSSRQSK